MRIDPTGWLILAVAAICFLIVAIGLKTGRTLGLLRGHFIVRRESEPDQFGFSLFVFALKGVFLTYVFVSVGLRS